MQTATAAVEGVRTSPDHWLFYLVVTGLLNLGGLVLFPQFSTDALTPGLALTCGVPALWGTYLFLFFRTRKQRLVGYIAMLPAIFWWAAVLHLLADYGWSW